MKRLHTRIPRCFRSFRPGQVPTGRSAYSVLELLVVMLVITLLLAMVFPAINSLRRGIKTRRARAETQTLVNAVLGYRNAYGQWPRQFTQDSEHFLVFGDPDWTFTSGFVPRPQGPVFDQAKLIAALTTNTVDNPRALRFIDLPEDRLEDSRFVDPWGRPYVVALDREGHNVFLTLNSDEYGRLEFNATNHPAAAASFGDPSRPDNPVVSWITP